MKQKGKTSIGKPPVAAIVIIVLAAVIVVAYWYSHKQVNMPDQTATPAADTTPANSNPAATTPPAPDAPPAKGTNSLSLADQIAGKTVTVDALSLATPGFVSIHENDNGKPGKIIGTSALIASGDKIDLVVKATVVSGKAYFAMLHIDDGSKKFNETKDLPAKTANGLIVMKQFSVK